MIGKAWVVLEPQRLMAPLCAGKALESGQLLDVLKKGMGKAK